MQLLGLLKKNFERILQIRADLTDCSGQRVITTYTELIKISPITTLLNERGFGVGTDSQCDAKARETR
jgi:hypothetical protein